MAEAHVRRATAGDAEAIGNVFDAAVKAGWAYLGELARTPMFTPGDWDELVADHGPPNALLLATEPAARVSGRVTYSQQILKELGWIAEARGRGVTTRGSGYSEI